MDYTQNLHLPQWEESDRIMMDDFNDAMQSIDAGVKAATDAAPRIVTGSYIGTGGCGSHNSISINFGFQPKIVFVVADSNSSPSGAVFVRPAGRAFSYSSDIITTWTSNDLSWYTSSSAAAQLNAQGVTYYYLAIQ